ncbi:hypothetical protein [Qipengyuania sp.]|uniref:hypothetical protein n=1 Tax=Qipengyuania sp. TaxID=2004515 RepID=UPI003BACC958
MNAHQPDTGAPSLQADELVAKISAYVLEFFRKRGKAVYLSAIGQWLSSEEIDFRSVVGEQGLAGFLQEAASEKLKVISHPEDTKILAVLPAEEADNTGAWPEPSTPKHHARRRPRIEGKIWEAFNAELSDGETRWLALQPTHDWQDNSSGKPSGNYLEIERRFIYPHATISGSRVDAVYELISEWCKLHNVNVVDLFHVPSGEGRGSALSLLLSVLDTPDLSRISMPLDVVAKLQRHSVR